MNMYIFNTEMFWVAIYSDRSSSKIKEPNSLCFEIYMPTL